MRFDTIVVIDWSAANDRGPRPKKDAIWACVQRNTATPPLYLRNRALAEHWLHQLLTAELAAGRKVLAGFDFPFGYPTGFAPAITGCDDPLALWDWFAANLTDRPDGNDRFALAGRLNALFPGTGPFWFNGTAQPVPDLPHKGTARAGHGLPERRLAETRAKGAFSLWQMGGAGAVGGQAMTGMAALSRLRARFPGQTAAWPFQPLDAPITLVEIWPSLIATAIAAGQTAREVKDAAQVRLLARGLWCAQTAGALAPMLADVPPEARSEGWILGLGHEAALAAPLATRRP